MKTLKFRWTGIRPVIMSNPQTVNIANPYAIASRRINNELKAARKKQAEERMQELAKEQQQNDFAASAYWQDGGFYLPDTVIIACLKQAAQGMKKGKDIDRSVIMTETEAPIKTLASFKTLESAFADKRYVLTCPCKIPPRTGALTFKARCMMPTGWQVEFSLEFDEKDLPAKVVEEINETAGLRVGVGGWRPKFGRFTSKAI